MALAFLYLESTSLATEADYPYTSGKGVTGTCDESSVGGPVKTSGFTQVPIMRPQQLKAAIA